MRKILLFATVISMAQFACKKPTASNRPAATPLDGSWRMILVTDNASGLTTTKPATIPNDVDITFTSVTPTNGTFTGVTPTNQIWENGYSTGTGETITIPALGITKAWETGWGFLFVGHIRSSLAYTLPSSDILNIRTINKTLTFRKLP
jgi:hypothetical protein